MTSVARLHWDTTDSKCTVSCSDFQSDNCDIDLEVFGLE